MPEKKPNGEPYLTARQLKRKRRERFAAKNPGALEASKRRRRRAYAIKRSYGMSEADYQRMYVIQGGRCAVCREAHERLAVDHCHQTGRVRGLLCRCCNTSLGFLKEDPLRAKALLDYIENRCEPAKKLGPVLA